MIKSVPLVLDRRLPISFTSIYFKISAVLRNAQKKSRTRIGDLFFFIELQYKHSRKNTFSDRLYN